jgi:ribonuclease HI
VGGILHISTKHSISFKAGVGQETNNYCELMALKLVLMLAQEFGVSHIQIFGDSAFSYSVDAQGSNVEEFHPTASVL